MSKIERYVDVREVIANVIQRRMTVHFPLALTKKHFSADAVTFWLKDDSVDRNKIFLQSKINRPDLDDREHEIHYAYDKSFIISGFKSNSPGHFIITKSQMNDIEWENADVKNYLLSNHMLILFIPIFDHENNIIGSIHLYYNDKVFLICDPSDMALLIKVISSAIDAISHENARGLQETRKIGHEVSRQLYNCKQKIISVNNIIKQYSNIYSKNRIVLKDTLEALDSAIDATENDSFISGIQERYRRSNYLSLTDQIDKVVSLSSLSNTSGRPYALNLSGVSDHIYIRIHATDFDLLLSNIFQNAQKYSEGPSPILFSARESQNELILTVSNLSKPLPSDEREAVWRYHVRGSNASSRPGRGVGLSVVSDICSVYDFGRELKQRSSGKTTWTDLTITVKRTSFRGWK